MNDVVIEAGRYSCPVCGEPARTVGDKKRHMREQHAEEER